MMSPALRRVVRRETHSPRTVAMLVVVTLVVLALAYTALEFVMHLSGQPPLLLDPAETFGWLVALPGSDAAGASTAAGVALAVIGLILVILAIAPGRLAKHEISDEDRAVVVDNGVIASAIAQHVSDELNLPRDRVRVGVGHRTIDVALTPHLGIPIDLTLARDIARTEVESYRLRPAPRVVVRAQQENVEKIA